MPATRPPPLGTRAWETTTFCLTRPERPPMIAPAWPLSIADRAAHLSRWAEDQCDDTTRPTGSNRGSGYPTAPRAVAIVAEPVIQDRIQCRGCGRWDHYAFTPEARADVVIEGIRLLTLLLSGNMTPRSAVTLVSSGLQDGRQMSPEDALRDYERRLAEDPDDPGLHVGHGNVLRFLKRFEAAAASYRRALDLDPHAVEAHWSLGSELSERPVGLDRVGIQIERGDDAEVARWIE